MWRKQLYLVKPVPTRRRFVTDFVTSKGTAFRMLGHRYYPSRTSVDKRFFSARFDRSQKPLIGWGFFKGRVRTTLTADLLRRLEARIRAAIESCFELLLLFAWPVCEYICSFINGSLRRKIRFLRNSMKLMGCSCLPTPRWCFLAWRWTDLSASRFLTCKFCCILGLLRLLLRWFLFWI